MVEVIKKGIIYLLSVLVAGVIVYLTSITDKYQLTPTKVYRVYLDGEVIGNIKDKKELEDYINEEQKDLKGKYQVDKVYVPQGVDIQKYNSYEKKLLTAKEVHNIIKEKKPFTVKGYKITIKPNSEEDKKIVINVLDKDMFDKSMKSVLKAFITEDEISNFENDTQEEIVDTGSLIEDIYIDQDITVKQSYISTDEEIFTDEKKLTKYLLFGEIKEDQFYIVKEGDTIETIAYNNKLAVEEFLIVNPEFTSSKNLLSVGQKVKVGLIAPLVDVVVEKHTVLDKESQYKTVTKYDSNKVAGIQDVITQGQNGIDRLTTKLKIVNGETQNVVIVNSEVLVPSVDKVVVMGTKRIGGGSYDPNASQSGDWVWPTIPQYYISSYVGYRWGRMHEGLDIAGCGEGSPIYAAGTGTVITSQYGHVSLGNYIIINHNNGYYTLYAHMRSLIAKQGQTVTKGQQIGTMGSTGRSTGTHLHFGLYKNAVPFRGGVILNPLSLYR